MMISTMSRDSYGYSWQRLSHLVWDSICHLCSKGALTKREAESLCIPAGLRSEEEIMAPFTSNPLVGSSFEVTSLEFSKTEVDGDTLHIFYKVENGKHVRPTKPVKITIVVKDLKDVNFDGAGELTIDGLETDELNFSASGAGNLKLNEIAVKNLSVTLSGAGNVTASGTADNLDLTISGVGKFDGKDLHSQVASANLSGVGSATVWVEDELDAEISGAGSVNYYGSATVTRQVSGIGSVNHMGDQ